jgi:hypothetical protein
MVLIPASFIWALYGGPGNARIENKIFLFDLIAAFPVFTFARRMGVFALHGKIRQHQNLIGKVMFWLGPVLFVLGIGCFYWRWEHVDAGDGILFTGIFFALLGVVFLKVGDRKGFDQPTEAADQPAESALCLEMPAALRSVVLASLQVMVWIFRILFWIVAGRFFLQFLA